MVTVQGWILVVTGILVGVPAAWIVVRTIRGPVTRSPTLWCELPPAVPPGFHVVVAVEAPLADKLPEHVGDLRAISVGVAGQPVGLMLDPGRYWLYATPARGPLQMIEAADLAFAAIRQDPARMLALSAEPVDVA